MPRDLKKETEEMRAGLEAQHFARVFSGKPVPKPRKGAYTTKAMAKAHPQSPKIPAKPYGSNVPKQSTSDVIAKGVGASSSRNQQLSQIDQELKKQK